MAKSGTKSKKPPPAPAQPVKLTKAKPKAKPKVGKPAEPNAPTLTYAISRLPYCDIMKRAADAIIAAGLTPVLVHEDNDDEIAVLEFTIRHPLNAEAFDYSYKLRIESGCISVPRMCARDIDSLTKAMSKPSLNTCPVAMFIRELIAIIEDRLNERIVSLEGLRSTVRDHYNRVSQFGS